MNSRQPRVSVVIPAWNEETFIGEAIESVLTQEGVDVDVLVVDDESTDRTVERTGTFGERVALIRTERGGACRARNLGARRSRGDFLFFLDADDFIGPGTLLGLVDALRGRRNPSIAICPWRFWKPAGGGWTAVRPPFEFEPPDLGPLSGWISGWWVPTCAVLWPRAVLDRVGPWDERLVANQDGDLMMRALLAGARLVRSGSGMGYYRKGHRPESASSSLSAEAFRSRVLVMRKVEAALGRRVWRRRYRLPLAEYYLRIAGAYEDADPQLAFQLKQHAVELAGAGAVHGSVTRRVAGRLLGIRGKRLLRSFLDRAL